MQVAKTLFYIPIVLSVAVHSLVYLEKKRVMLRRVHLEVLYEISLLVPSILLLAHVASLDQMPLIFVLLLSCVAIFGRARDCVTFAKSASKTKWTKSSWVDIVFIFISTCSALSLLGFCFVCVWHPAVAYVFNMQPIGWTAATGTFIMMIVGSAVLVIDHDLWTKSDGV